MNIGLSLLDFLRRGTNLFLLTCLIIAKTKLVVGLLETRWPHNSNLGPRWPSNRVISDRIHRLFVTLSFFGRIGSCNSLV